MGRKASMPSLRRGAQALPRLPPRVDVATPAPKAAAMTERTFVPVSEGSAGAAQLHVAFGYRPSPREATNTPAAASGTQPARPEPTRQVSLVPAQAEARIQGPAPRKDHHSVQPYSRGSKSAALAIASDPTARERARSALAGQAYTAGSSSARAAKLATWAELAQAAGFEDPFHITENLVYTVVGCLKAAGYRSAESYMHLAKQHCVASGRSIADATMVACGCVARAA